MNTNSLFKYGALSQYSEAVFSSPTIWLSPPEALNDPFECRPWFSFDGEGQQVIRMLTRYLQRAQRISLNEALAQAAEIWQLGRHRDPRIMEQMRTDIVSGLTKDVGLYCMSRTNNNILMWSHYANNHAGYCLEFEASDSTPVFGFARAVTYSEEFPVVNIYQTPVEDQIDLIFLTKYVGWRYEEEYRIIAHQSGPGLHKYPAQLLRSVTFGLRMKNEERETIRRWLRGRGCDVKLYQALIDQKQFKVVVTSTD